MIRQMRLTVVVVTIECPFGKGGNEIELPGYDT